jgi:hypothetical protein
MNKDPKGELLLTISPYAYTRNDPLNAIDPDGMKDEKARDYARAKLLNIPYGSGLAPYPGADWRVVHDELLTCDQLIARAYREGGGHLDFPVGMLNQVDWFEAHASFSTDRNSAEIGDALFFGDVSAPNRRHEVLVSDTKDENGVRYYRYVGARFIDSKTSENYHSKESEVWATIATLESWFGKKYAGCGAVNSESNQSLPEVAPFLGAFNDRAFRLGPSPQQMWILFHPAPADQTRIGH